MLSRKRAELATDMTDSEGKGTRADGERRREEARREETDLTKAKPTRISQKEAPHTQTRTGYRARVTGNGDSLDREALVLPWRWGGLPGSLDFTLFVPRHRSTPWS